MKVAGLWKAGEEEFVLKPDLERCADARLKREVLEFLRGGTGVLRSPVLREDRLDPSRRDAVPLGYLTDGAWVWPEELAYYLEVHDVLPQAEFLDHMRARDFKAPQPGDDALAEAHRLLTAQPQ